MKNWIALTFALLLASAHFAARADAVSEQLLLLKKYKCLVCHGMDNKVVGPSFRTISQHSTANDVARLSGIIKKGSVNVWGSIPMPAFKKISDDEAINIANWIIGLNPANAMASNLVAQNSPENFIPATPEIYVLDLAQFERYNGPDVSKIGAAERGLDIAKFDRHRLGAVQLAPNLRVYVDKLTLPDTVEYEFINTLTGEAIKGAGPIGGRYGATALRFTGDGVVYATEKFACHQGGTFKYVLRGKELAMAPQPLIYMDMKTSVEGDVKLFQNADGGNEVGRLQNGAEVTVIGRAPDNRIALLVKAPIGLTGWIIEGEMSGGRLLIDACN